MTAAFPVAVVFFLFIFNYLLFYDKKLYICISFNNKNLLK